MKKKKILFLYGNTPDQTVEERIFFYREKLRFDVKIFFIKRINSSISFKKYLSFLNDNEKNFIEAKDSRGFSLRKLINIFKIIFFIIKLKEDVEYLYSFYPDMHLASVLLKILRPRIKLIHEIQDLNPMPRVVEKIYFYSLKYCEHVNCTSQGYIDYLRINKKLKNIKFQFFPNFPYKNLYSSLKIPFGFENKMSKKNFIVFGFFGILRYQFQIDFISKMIRINEKIHYIIAGNGDFFQKAKIKFNKSPRVIFFENFTSNDLNNKILPKIDIVPCIYPNHLNYDIHLARRFSDSLSRGIPVIIFERSKYMKKYINKYDVGFVFKNLEDLQNNISLIIDNIHSKKSNAKNFKEFFTFDKFIVKNNSSLINN